ncbi:MAG: 16S rRNA (adenine(1518)-N(6)/adenine(1519)-N(6))-dimethyltransferase RsmA [Clostridia bacterium]|nr:16S rRNA (adenine(1518)-N(6)/adenine(1519)-N(6))-dimethyltransferase RsmA [Clostridia bacterium]
MRNNEDNMFHLMSKYQIKTVQSLGQNFLKDKNTAMKIIDAADLTQEDLVIEVGMGAGSLSKIIASKCRKLVGIEIDKKLIPLLKDYLNDCDNVEIIHEDVLKVDIIKDILEKNREFKSYKVIANLPYYITTAVIMKFLQCSEPPALSVLMMQREVADRILAGPGTKTYGGLSVIVNYYCDTVRVANVSPDCFVPKPDVNSTVLKFIKNSSQKVQVKDKELFFKIVKASFAQRRKKVTNSLANTLYLDITREDVEAILVDMGLDVQVRAERLSIEQFAQIADSIYHKLGQEKN